MVRCLPTITSSGTLAQPRLTELNAVTMKTLAMVLAGGEGKRLMPLTADRAKPAVPFGGRYRIIDFVLSNMVNSGIRHIKVLTQYKSESLLKHLSRNWGRFAGFGGFIEALPPQMNVSRDWYLGSLDAIFQNLNIVREESPDIVAVFGSDHIYKMDLRKMIAFHTEKRATATVAAIAVPTEHASRFGCISVDENNRMIDFEEKPTHPPEIPGQPGLTLASMGNYLFDRDVLVRESTIDAARQNSRHDFGLDLIPYLHQREPVYVYDFLQNVIPGEEGVSGYWIDIGTIDAYFQASMDLVSVSPTLNLYNQRWPIRSFGSDAPPAKFVFADQESKRIGTATDSMVCEGCIISGGHIERSLLSPWVRLNSFSHVSESILFEGVDIGRHCRIRRTIIDKDVRVPEGTVIGYDRANDERRFGPVLDGVVVIRKGSAL
ncbi:MAG: glucose-1-phosphate adenylyltransferase [Myxococcales bacterium]|nr:glucose-1-phosphate adenylyltransferase [Myxococcales bacterium]